MDGIAGQLAVKHTPLEVCNEWQLWRYDMEALSALLAFCEANPPATRIYFPHKRPVAPALVFSLMLVQTNCCTNSQVAGNLRRHDAHVME